MLNLSILILLSFALLIISVRAEHEEQIPPPKNTTTLYSQTNSVTQNSIKGTDGLNFTSSSTIRTTTSKLKLPTNDIPKVNNIPLEEMNMIKGIIPTTSTANPINVVNTYRVYNAEDGTTCILMKVDALIIFEYKNKLKKNQQTNIFIPSPNGNEVSLIGDCEDGEKSSMRINWNTFTLNFDFAKTPGGERWYVESIQLNFNTNEKVFNTPIYENTNINAETREGSLLFPTPVGSSFQCRREIRILLEDSEYPDFKAKLLLRKLAVEPFIFKNDDFGPEYMCAAAGGYRSETAPFIFGSLLTFASLSTVGGYAAFRYFKENKVQYDAMD